MKKIYIIHGYYASVNDHWFPWLEKELANDAVVTRVAMPNSKHPQLEKWLETLSKKVELDKDTYIVAHSLGCITAARYLALKDISIGGAIFVAGFDYRVPDYSTLDEFVKDIPDMSKVGNLLTKKLTFVSTDDPIVPTERTIKFASDINSPVESFNNAGHFMATDGFSEFPHLAESVRSMLS